MQQQLLDIIGGKKIIEIKGQLISKANCQALNSSKKRTNEFVFTPMRRVFVRFLEESWARKKTFRDYLTFNINLFNKGKCQARCHL